MTNSELISRLMNASLIAIVIFCQHRLSHKHARAHTRMDAHAWRTYTHLHANKHTHKLSYHDLMIIRVHLSVRLSIQPPLPPPPPTHIHLPLPLSVYKQRGARAFCIFIGLVLGGQGWEMSEYPPAAAHTPSGGRNEKWVSRQMWHAVF